MRETLIIQLLGVPQIVVNQEALTFRLAKSYGLLYYLVAEIRLFSRSELADLFWPDSKPHIGRRHLSNRLVDIRPYVGDHISITRNMLGVEKTICPYVDIHQLSTLTESNGYDEAVLSPAQMRDHRQAVDLYRGEFLQGFYLPETPIINDWVEHHREEMRTKVAHLLYHLTQAEMTTGNHPQAYADIERLLTLAPWHEGAYQLKM
ncbi:MAG: bacterial transcriptional activator domain-containing protein, partial [Chloroflexota bacterium]